MEEIKHQLEPEFKQLWLKALRSGDYKQAKTELYDPKVDGYCCLGVACIVKGMSKEDIMHKGYPIDVDISIRKDFPMILSDDYLKGDEGEIIRSNTGEFIATPAKLLARMNDIENKTFVEIADYIEQNL